MFHYAALIPILISSSLHLFISFDFPTGLMIGVEFADEVAYGTAGLVTKAAAKNHQLLLLTAGVYETIRWIPPLIVSKQEIQEGLKRFESALNDVFSKK